MSLLFPGEKNGLRSGCVAGTSLIGKKVVFLRALSTLEECEGSFKQSKRQKDKI